MSATFEIVAEAQIGHGHSVTVIDIGGDDYRIDIQSPTDGGKTRELRLSVTEAEALLQSLMDAVG